jgi:methylated-DNA-protein-cysteine methyltransferase-like protein
MPSRSEIYQAVARIPAGKVSTYGRVARSIGLSRGARQVGYALAALDAGRNDVPWHRVINAAGRISRRADPGCDDLQRRLLEAEGVQFDEADRVDLGRYLFSMPE